MLVIMPNKFEFIKKSFNEKIIKAGINIRLILFKNKPITSFLEICIALHEKIKIKGIQTSGPIVYPKITAFKFSKGKRLNIIAPERNKEIHENRAISFMFLLRPLIILLVNVVITITKFHINIICNNGAKKTYSLDIHIDKIFLEKIIPVITIGTKINN